MIPSRPRFIPLTKEGVDAMRWRRVDEFRNINHNGWNKAPIRNIFNE